MSQCPFWSINGEKFACYSECPMSVGTKENEICPFKEFSTAKTISLRDIDSYGYDEEFTLLHLPKLTAYK
ncbi:hypothetical protein [Clostridium sp. YIM B02551]|uniref:hypothetical protein n=1 Tax=Clostridium sp. YIM B02551 TaxID=2910679 RepID=UPI001EEB09F3|nr:hypothetical protein [Clostridium sp. YIM B02551]